MNIKLKPISKTHKDVFVNSDHTLVYKPLNDFLFSLEEADYQAELMNYLAEYSICPRATYDETYFIMDYVDGSMLSQYEDITDDLFIKIMRLRCKMHYLGVAHNDLHDENIMITTEGRVIFIDFDDACEDRRQVINELQSDICIECEVLHHFSEDIKERYYDNLRRMDDLSMVCTGWVEEYYKGWDL